MKVKQLKDLLNKHPDDMEVRIWDLDTVFKPDDDLFLMSGDTVNSQLLLVINDDYNNENFEVFDNMNHSFTNINRLDYDSGIDY